MSRPETDPVTTPFEDLLGARPELLRLYRAFYGTLWDRALAPPALLELCRLRIAMLHDCEAELVVRQPGAGVTEAQIAALAGWQTSDRFSAAERAALTLAEKMPWQHHEISDAEVAALRDALGDPGVVAVMVALALFDANCRLKLAFNVPAQPAAVAAPASATGPLY